MFKHRIIMLLMAVVLMSAGCPQAEFTINIRFERIDGLIANDRLLFEQNAIGSVKSVNYTPQGDYQVEIGVQPGFLNAMTEFSRFYVIDDPQLKPQKAIEVLIEQQGGKLLANGAQVKGSNRASALEKLAQNFGQTAETMKQSLAATLDEIKNSMGLTADELKSGLGQSIDQLSRQLEQLAEDMRKIPTDKYIKDLERSLDQLAGELEKSGEAVRDKIQQELLPELQKQLNELRDRLKKEGREPQMDPLDKKMDGIKKI